MVSFLLFGLGIQLKRGWPMLDRTGVLYFTSISIPRIKMKSPAEAGQWFMLVLVQIIVAGCLFSRPNVYGDGTKTESWKHGYVGRGTSLIGPFTVSIT